MNSNHISYINFPAFLLEDMLILSPSSCPRTIIKCYKRESKDNVFAGSEISLHQTRINKIVLYFSAEPTM
jgi:hypothetical protein